MKKIPFISEPRLNVVFNENPYEFISVKNEFFQQLIEATNSLAENFFLSPHIKEKSHFAEWKPVMCLRLKHFSEYGYIWDTSAGTEYTIIGKRTLFSLTYTEKYVCTHIKIPSRVKKIQRLHTI